LYNILDVYESEEGVKMIRIGDPWANSPKLLEDGAGIYDVEYETFLESFNKLVIVKVKKSCELFNS